MYRAALTGAAFIAAILTSSCGSNCLELGTAGSVCGEREATVPILEDGQGMPVVAGTLDGVPIRLLLDSGASRILISATLLGQKPEGYRTVSSLCIGTLCLSEATVWARDSVFSAPDVGAINGLIGIDVLGAFLVEFDHGRSVVFNPKAGVCAGTAVPLSLDGNGRPMVAASLDGESLGAILLDTGALYTLFAETTAAKAPYLAESAVSSTGCSIDGCTTGLSTSQARQVCVGDVCMSDVPVKYPVWDAIGDSFLFQHRVDLDCPRERLIFCDP
jgi:predicted aspartyl protease